MSSGRIRPGERMQMYEVGDHVTWVGSRLAAPGPGKRYSNPVGPGFHFGLYGEVVRVSPSDPESIKIRWDNGRVTIERAKNISHQVAWG